MAEKLITFPTAGALPGIPGEHAAGNYWVDFGARTIRPAASLDTQPEPLQGEGSTQEKTTQSLKAPKTKEKE